MLVAALVRLQIDEREEAIKDVDLQEEKSITSSGLSVERGLACGGAIEHIALGSKYLRIPLDALERTKSSDRAFNRFRLRLAEFLSRSLPAYGISLNRWIKFEPGDKVCILLGKILFYQASLRSWNTGS